MKLLERIRNAIASGKVKYWENRPQHLTRADFDEVFSGTPDLSKLQMAPRESIGGEHGLDGEDSVYKGAISIAGFGGTRILYLKFFFWKKGDPHGEQGIEVQSFKLWSPKNV